MADIELVIKIPEEVYQRYKKVWQRRRGSIPESNIAFGIPLQKGHWIDEAMHIKCSQCGTEFNDDIINMSYDVGYPIFCPKCGAKMEVEE